MRGGIVMKIENNIIKEHLKNVLFISGGAYGGKTTMAKLIEEKYGFVRYREGDNWDYHFSYANEKFQPAICCDRSKFTYEDWNDFYNRKPEEYHQWLMDGLREEAEMAIIDLIKLSQNQKVVADVMIPIDILKEIADYNQVVLLYAPVKMKREHYFDREDKKMIFEHIMTMKNPDKALENCLNSLTYKGEEEIESFKNSGFKYIERSEISDIEETMAAIEEHFGLCNKKRNQVYIKTDRLVIRSFVESDFEQFKELMDMPEYIGWQMQKPRAMEFFQWQLSNYEEMDIVKGSVCLGIFDASSGKIIGQIAAQKHDYLDEPEFGYGILPFARGKGYAKEAAVAVLNWIKDNYNIPFIIGTTDVDNVASQKILDYCGFELIDEKNLLVHIINEQHDFKYYRYYLDKNHIVE